MINTQRQLNISLKNNTLVSSDQLLGYEGEHNATILNFVLSDALKNDNYKYVLTVITGDGKAYDAELVNYNFVVPQSLYVPPMALLALTIYNNDPTNTVILKTGCIALTVLPSSYNTQLVDDQYSGLLIDSIDKFDEAVQTLNNITINAPKILDNGNWAVYDPTAGKYVDTGVSATGGGGTSNYTDLTSKPQINGVELIGDKSAVDVGIIIPTLLSQLTNDKDYTTNAALQSAVNNLAELIATKADAKYVTTALTNINTLLATKANSSDVPSKTSQLSNDSDYTTSIALQSAVTSLNEAISAKPSTEDVQQAVAVKADSLRLTDNTLQLISNNLPIGSPVTIPTGGGSTDTPYRLIADITLTEAVGSVVVSKDTNGNAFSITDVLITSSTKSTNTTNYYVVSVNGRNIYAGQDQNNIFYNRNIRLNRVSVDTDVANSYTYNYQYTRYTNVLNPNATYSAMQSLNADKISTIRVYLNSSDLFVAGSTFKVWGK